MQQTRTIRLINVPGYTNSGPEHWQSRWEANGSGWSRIGPLDWDHPDPASWSAAIDREVRRSSDSACLVAHSLGCLAVAHWAGRSTGSRVIAAFLVAPADPEVPALKGIADTFSPVPMATLPFSSLLVFSRDDPYAGRQFSEQCARAWGSRLVDLGNAGHINTASGFGPWPEGEKMLSEWLGKE